MVFAGNSELVPEFLERAFTVRYKKAYNKIVPAKECLDRLTRKIGENEGKGSQHRLFAGMGTAAAVLAVLCLMVMLALPATVRAMPGFYELLVKYAPALADYCLPEEYSCTSQGISMQVEAVKSDGNTVEIILSFSDAEGSGDLIHGTVEMGNGYGIRSYGGESSVGGASFLGYDEAADKAYFKMDVTSYQKMDKAKMVLTVNQLMTIVTEEGQWVAMDDMVKEPAVREVIIFGRGGTRIEYFLEKGVFRRVDDSPQPDDPRIKACVMDIRKADAGLDDELTVMGIGYLDGVLRVQVCRGACEDAERHAQLFLVDSGGKERIEDSSVGWSEEIEGEKFSFDEHWFIVDEADLESLYLYGIFYRREGCVNGGWEVTLELE